MRGWNTRGEVIPYGDKDDLYTAVAQVTHSSNLAGGIPRLQAEIAIRKPERPEFYMELGDALQRAGRSEESAAAYRAAIEKRPDSALLWARLAQPLRAMGKSQEPLAAMLKAAQADPNQPAIWYDLALLQSELGDKNSAIESFRKSITLSTHEFARAVSVWAQCWRKRVGLRMRRPNSGALCSSSPRCPRLTRISRSCWRIAATSRRAIWHFERAGEGAVNQFNYGITLPPG